MPDAWKPSPYTGPTAQDLTRLAPPNLGGGAGGFGGPPKDMQYWLGVKYANIGKQTEGEYQKNISDASTLPGLREAQGGAYNAAAQLDTERAANEADRNISPDDARREYRLRQLGILPGGQGPASPAAPGAEAPPPLSSAPPPVQWTPQPWRQSPMTPVAPARPAAPLSEAPLSAAPRARSPLTQTPLLQLPTLVRPPAPLMSNSLTGFRKGTADVKAPKGAGLKKGSANVGGKSKGKSSKGSDPPAGLEALLSALAAAHGGGAGAPPAMGGSPMPMPIPPGGAAPPGFAYGVPSVPSADAGVGAGPNYPFGAGYLFGATTVPGEGSGKTDTVPAMLAPHEAVLNRAAADMLGRGLIAALNQHGVAQMGMRRGATT